MPNNTHIIEEFREITFGKVYECHEDQISAQTDFLTTTLQQLSKDLMGAVGEDELERWTEEACPIVSETAIASNKTKAEIREKLLAVLKERGI